MQNGNQSKIFKNYFNLRSNQPTKNLLKKRAKLELEAKKKAAQVELSKQLTEERLEKEKNVRQEINNKITHTLTKLEVKNITFFCF